MESNYSKPYIEELGKKRVLELFYEQKDDFERATIINSVYEDGEGNSYNSIKWADGVEKGGNEIEV